MGVAVHRDGVNASHNKWCLRSAGVARLFLARRQSREAVARGSGAACAKEEPAGAVLVLSLSP